MLIWIKPKEATDVRIGDPPAEGRLRPDEIGTGIFIVARVNPKDRTPLSNRKPIQIGEVDVGNNRQVYFGIDDAIEGKQVVPNQTELAPGPGIDIPVTVFVKGAKKPQEAVLNIKAYEDFKPDVILNQLRQQIKYVEDLMRMEESLIEIVRRFRTDSSLGIRASQIIKENLPRMLPGSSQDSKSPS
jgi:hypothetical protein